MRNSPETIFPASNKQIEISLERTDDFFAH